ncbi:MAG: M48 family metallopeptidase [Synergistaceae bacterium]|jgi:predicted metal-dependent hydrolase|nr:M48 family metallopeptidase [Synergistaceae bacterium]
MNGRSYADGEIFLYGGKPYALASGIAHEGSPRVEASEEKRLVVRAPLKDRRKFLIYWYTSETEKIVRALAPKWSKKLGVRPRSITVKFTRTRWGSCSSSGRIFFNCRMSMLSPDVAQYIVVHELCHLKQMNHSPRFWDEVRSALPDAMPLRRSLREQERAAAL